MTSRQQFIGTPDNATTERNQNSMTGYSLWCSIDDPETNYIKQIGHPFSESDPDRKHYAQTEIVQVPTGNSYGQTTYQNREQVTEEINMCGYHWRKSNPFAAKKKEIPPPDSAQATLDELEEEDADYRRGYEAGRDSAYRDWVAPR